MYYNYKELHQAAICKKSGKNKKSKALWSLKEARIPRSSFLFWKTDREVDGRYDETDGATDKGPQITSVTYTRAHCGPGSATALLRPMRTAGPKWYNARLYGEFAALWFFLMTKSGCEEGLLPSFQTGPACALIIVRISASIMGCSNQDGCRT